MPPKGSKVARKQPVAAVAESDPAPVAAVHEEVPILAPTPVTYIDDGERFSDDDEELHFSDADDLDERKEIVVGGPKAIESESDDSEDEATLNRVGDIPMEWYEDLDHMGYDVDGQKIMKPKGSALDELIAETDDPNKLRTIVDPQTGRKIVLSNHDLAILFNMQRNRAPNPEYAATAYEDAPESTVDFDPLNHPLARGGGPSKKTFVPRLHEMKRLKKMIARMLAETDEEKTVPAETPQDEIKDLWDKPPVLDTRAKFRLQYRVPKPNLAPPGTYESYRPPPEYLPSEKAKSRHAQLRVIDRKEHFTPQQFATLRHVPFYHHYIQDIYQRCLDLSTFPRMTRTRLVVDPDKLLPELPDPKDLKPYPERLSFLYRGHTGTVRSISVSPSGQYLATACDDHLVRIFEITTGRLMKRYDLGAVVQQVEFCPNKAMNVVVAAVEFSLVFIVPPFCAHPSVSEHTIRTLRAPAARILAEGEREDAAAAGVGAGSGHGITQARVDLDETAYEGNRDLDDEVEKERRADFIDASARERAAGILVKVVMHARVKKFTFHARGDYVCALCPKDHVKYRQTVMLQLSKRKVFCPFRKFSEVVTDCRFHPTGPLFFLSTTNSVRCYNLLAHKMQKRLRAQGGITTCIDIHPEGDNVILGDTTHHTVWYDTDFSDKPYKKLRSHKGVVNAVGFHRRTNAYPLFASAASDGQCHIFHGMVYDDYNRNALIVPLKILKHKSPVYALAWHPTLPWIFTSTEDGSVSCWTE